MAYDPHDETRSRQCAVNRMGGTDAYRKKRSAMIANVVSAVSIAAITAIAGMIFAHETRIVTLEGDAKRLDRIEQKLDRLIERGTR
jgi:hypothetical protein